MPKEILTFILNEKMLPEIALIIIAYFFSGLIFFRLAFQLYGVKSSIPEILAGAFLCTVYSILGRQIVPDWLFPILLLVLFTCMIILSGKLTFFKAVWATFIVHLIGYAGVIVIGQPLFLAEGMKEYLFSTPQGIIIGTVIESVFPALGLVLLSSFKIRLGLPFRKKITKTDLLSLVMFSLLFISIYIPAIAYIIMLKYAPTPLLFLINVLETVCLITAIAVFFYLRRIIREQREREQLDLLREQGERLKQVVARQDTEFRDRLQMIHLLLTLGNQREADVYIKRTAMEMSVTPHWEIENPVLASIILSWQIFAREAGIKYLVRCDTRLGDSRLPVLVLSEIINRAMELMMDAEPSDPVRIIQLTITEDEKNYRFEVQSNLKTNRKTMQVSENKWWHLLKPEDRQRDQLRQFEELVMEVNGCCEYLFQERFLVKVAFSLPKKQVDIPALNLPPFLTRWFPAKKS